MLPEGIIEPAPASPIGFTPDVFTGVMYLHGKDLWISLISVFPSKQDQGYFTRMLNRVLRMGYRVRVACPSTLMAGILERRGFRMAAATCRSGICNYMEGPV